jgi:hypothetical protein
MRAEQKINAQRSADAVSIGIDDRIVRGIVACASAQRRPKPVARCRRRRIDRGGTVFA